MIIPAILEESYSEIEKKVRLMEDVAETIEIDVVDNTLAEGRTFLDVSRFKDLKSRSDITLHPQVKDPMKYLKRSGFLFLPTKRKIEGVSTIITQLTDESLMTGFLNFCDKVGYKKGISINFNEDLELLRKYISRVSIVQFMSVIPGKQGNEFIPSVLDKIKQFKTLFPSVVTQIDGGVNQTNIIQILETGVDNVVVGSSIFNTEDPKKEFLELSSLAEEFKKDIKSAHGTNN